MTFLKILGKIPDEIGIAVSGGVDSMAALDFISNGKRNITAYYFNHNTTFGDKCEAFVTEYCKHKDIELIKGSLKRGRASDESIEEYWRNERYDFLRSSSSKKIITCHHLDDAVETWIFSSLNGEGKLIPYHNKGIIRPFLMCEKESLVNWCIKRNVPYLTDPSNFDVKFIRNLIRRDLVPIAKKVNPGINKVIRKKILNSFK